MKFTTRVAYILIAALIISGGAVTTFAASKKAPPKGRVLSVSEKKLLGSYRCQSYNVSGAGSGNCRLAPPLILNADGTYSLSSERGTFSLKKSSLKLSQSKIRGAGKVTLSPPTITFSYKYRGWKHVITYAKESTAKDEIQVPAQRVSAPVPATVPVELTVNFPESDGSVSWVNVIMLVPEGYTPASASYRPESLAIQEGRSSTLHASFYGNKEVTTGKVYDVYASSGFDSQKVGSLDLRSPKGLVKTVITALPAATATESQPANMNTTSETQTPAQTQAEAPQKTDCNPLIPRYAGGC